jgi:putative ABC transport system permease protein
MKTPLAWLNLVHQKARTSVAVAGVAFAIILVFMQLGFHGSVLATATLLYDKLDFDLALISTEYLHTGMTGQFPIDRLAQARSIPGVQSAVPFYISFNRWRNPETRGRRHIMVLGFRIGDRVFLTPEVNRQAEALKQPDTVLMDRRSRPEFGRQDIGIVTEVGTHKVQIVGQFTMGAGFSGDGTILVSDTTFTEIFDWPLERVSLGLIKLAPGASVETAAAQLSRVLPADVMVQTRAAMEARDKEHWARNTSIGIIFNLGVLVAFTVGIVFVYQVISSDIANHLSEYATLKAIGYSNGYLAGVVLKQAVILSVLGYIPGLLIALALYEFTARVALVPIEMNYGRAVFVFALAVAMCAISGLLSLQKLRAADPADLF